MSRYSLKKIAIFCTFLALNIFLWTYFDIGNLLSFESIKNNRDFLLEAVNTHYWRSVVIYMLVYIADAALFLPATAIMIMLGGFLFGVLPTVLYGMISATIGAVLAFSATRYLFGKSMQRKYQEKFDSFNKQLASQGVYYLLFARIVPIFPFFIVNILAGLTLLPLRTFALTTAFGIVPNLIIYACIGRELTTASKFSDLININVVMALIILTLFSILPLIATSKKKSSAQ